MYLQDLKQQKTFKEKVENLLEYYFLDKHQIPLKNVE